MVGASNNMFQALITVPMLIAFLGSIHFATILHTNWNRFAPKLGLCAVVHFPAF